jgi:hypothetical protein
MVPPEFIHVPGDPRGTKARKTESESTHLRKPENPQQEHDTTPYPSIQEELVTDLVARREGQEEGATG